MFTFKIISLIIKNLSECAECVHRILAARVDDKAAQAFCASAATVPKKI